MSMATSYPSLYLTEKEKKEWWRKVEDDSDYYLLSTKGSVGPGSVLEDASTPIRPKAGGKRMPEARSRVVKIIVEILQDKENFQDKLKIKTNEVYEGGSVKHGGTAVPGHFDVDLVLFSDSLDYQECTKDDGYAEKLEDIHKHFQSTLHGKYKYINTHKVTLEFKYVLDGLGVTVKLSLSPYWHPDRPRELFDVLKAIDSHEKRELFIPSTMKLQTEYIQCVDRQSHGSLTNDWICRHIHALIRRAKAWRDGEKWPTDDDGVVQEPNSYLLSLLVIEAYNKVPREHKFTESTINKLHEYADRVTEEFKKIVKDLGKPIDRDELTKPRNKALQDVRSQHSQLLPVSRWLTDPANPANNVYASGMPGRKKDTGWKAFAEKVDTTDLKKTADETIKIMRPIRRAREIVKAISDTLKEEAFKKEVGIKASEIFVGGSLGQGTINYEHFDIDLVLYSTSLLPKERDVAATGYEDILEKLDAYLQKNMNGYVYMSMTDYAVKCKVKDYEIDLLLSPRWETRDALYSHLRTVKPPLKRLMFSASASKYQVEFVKRQPNRLKILVARFKGWRNRMWEHSDEWRPKSYCLTLLMISAYHSAPEEVVKASKIERLANWVTEELKSMVKTIQSDDTLDLAIPGADEEIMRKYSDLLPPKPRIVDPVNPANNVFLSGIGGKKRLNQNKWGIFAAKIDSLMLAPTKTCIQDPNFKF